MPCRDDRDDDCFPTYDDPVANFDTTGALCDVLTMLEENFRHVFFHVDKATVAWWQQHEKRERERIKKEALAKLTLREKRALGLK